MERLTFDPAPGFAESGYVPWHDQPVLDEWLDPKWLKTYQLIEHDGTYVIRLTIYGVHGDFVHPVASEEDGRRVMERIRTGDTQSELTVDVD